MLLLQLNEARRIFKGCFGIVDRARPDDDKKTIIFPLDNRDGLRSALEDGLF